jgi:hypothetical protein
MRGLVYLAVVMGSAAAGSAGAQTAITPPSNAAPARSIEAFVGKAPPPVLNTSKSSASALADAAFAPRSPTAAADPVARLIDSEAYKPGQGLVRWNSGEVQLSNRETGAVDSLRVSVGGTLNTPGGAPINLDRAQFQADAYEISLIREWPKALSFEGKAFDVDLSPHAGVGVSNYGGSAEAGAQVRVSRDEKAARKLKDMGISDGAAFGEMGRWYLYGAVSGRAVGLNMLHSDGGWDRAGWTTDATSGLMGDVQLGVGWRKGVMQSSLGLIHREVKGQHMIWGQQTRDDSLVAFSLSIKPQR